MMDHTESVLIEYDPSQITFREILNTWRSLGTPYPAKTQYRWAVFYLNEAQREIAEEFGGTISGNQVSRVEKRALSKLRSPNSLATYKFLAYLDFAGIDSSTAKLD